MHRTHTCWELTRSNIWQTVTLSGWVANRRDHGWVIFIDLRDRYWITQIVFDPEVNKETVEIADKVRWEYVIKISWTVRSRPEGQNNEKIVTWEIEIICNQIEILTKAKELPFEISEYANAWEEIRYKYRYLDLRRESVKNKVIFRSKFLNFVRNWFFNNEFIEVQTPIFTVSSPEWARDYLVPSRLHPGKFYALPQAPQQYKQLLMVWGMDKYFQVAPCFRDEDTRADRHACEFYQIDCEMSFVEQEDIFQVAEKFIIDLVKTLAPHKRIKENKIFRLTHHDALDNYGSDKPDLRFGMKFKDIWHIFSNTEFSVFKDVLANWWVIKAMKSTWIQMSRKDIDDLTEVAKKEWAKWLAYIIYDEEGRRSPILKFFSEVEIAELEKIFNPQIGDIIFFSASEFETAVWVLNKVRLAIRDKWNLVDKDELAISWIMDFPFYEMDKDSWKIDFAHNPFSMPTWWMKAFEEKDPLKISSQQYDLACNWYEILSGSIRNNSPEVLVKAFELVGKWEQEVIEKFWWMYNAFQYWAPPHWGFAFGMDRLMMILTDEENIRDIYAFPKSGKAQDTMMWAPWDVDPKQLKELNIKIVD